MLNKILHPNQKDRTEMYSIHEGLAPIDCSINTRYTELKSHTTHLYALVSWSLFTLVATQNNNHTKKFESSHDFGSQTIGTLLCVALLKEA